VPRGVLEVGHDVAEAGPQTGGQVRLEQIRAQAVPIGLHRDEVRVGAGQRLQGSDVRRSLDHDVVAGIDQGPGQQVEPLLRAGGDQDILSVALATASGVRVGHPLAQQGSLGRAVLDGLGPVAPGAGQHASADSRSRPTGKLSGDGRPPASERTVRPVGEVRRCADDRRGGASTAPGEQVSGVRGDGQAHGDSVAATPGAGKRDPGAPIGRADAHHASYRSRPPGAAAAAGEQDEAAGSVTGRFRPVDGRVPDSAWSIRHRPRVTTTGPGTATE
jgi:hypothetical protein